MGVSLAQGQYFCPQVKLEAKDRPTAHLKPYLVLGCKLSPTPSASQTFSREKAREKGLPVSNKWEGRSQRTAVVSLSQAETYFKVQASRLGLSLLHLVYLAATPGSEDSQFSQRNTEPHNFPENTEDCVSPPGVHSLSLQLHFPELAQPTCNRVLC